MNPATIAAESIVAVLGIEHALRPKPQSPSAAALTRAAKLERVAAKRVRDLLDLGKPQRQMGPPELPDYREMHQRLGDGIDGDVLAETLVGVPLELQAECVRVWTGGVAYLDRIFPRRTEPRLTGVKLHDPSAGEWAEWGWAWRIANAPLIALDLMGEGMLITAEVNHLLALYPALYGAICGSIGDGLADRAAGNDDWQPPWWLRKQLCTFLQVSPVSPTLIADIEAAVKQSQAQTQQRASKLQVTNTGSTPAQRLADK